MKSFKNETSKRRRENALANKSKCEIKKIEKERERESRTMRCASHLAFEPKQRKQKSNCSVGEVFNVAGTGKRAYGLFFCQRLI